MTCAISSPPCTRGLFQRAGFWFPLLMVTALLLAGCGGPADPIDPTARRTVDRIQGAPTPTRWSFRYLPDSASPYLACLGGVDGATGVVDLEAGAVMVRPDRNTPPIIVTDSEFMVAANARVDGPWKQVQWTEADDPARLLPLFGDILAGYVATGIRAPDLNMTTLAAISIADTVEPVSTPAGFTGDTLRITVDPDRYLAELDAQELAGDAEERDRVPAFTVTVDDSGLVTTVTVDATPAGTDEADHRDRYFLTATYDDTEPLTLPTRAERIDTRLSDVEYPSADESCEFQQ